ncbi:glycosyltransferase [Marinilabiliaceae bacterium ANBcel2]|nr:glycosyltransferase [Marinilabiliaceae bacterium ANBcel2]
MESQLRYQSKDKPIALIAPLNWGLGHACRDIPVIYHLKNKGYRVIAVTEEPLTSLIKKSVPDIETDLFKGPKIVYSKKSRQIARLILQIPSFIIWLQKEKRRTKELVEIYNPKIIVSDNRYGVRNKKTINILITHQLMIKTPKLLKPFEYPLHKIVNFLISKFDKCWIPDNSKENSLAGDLVYKYPLPNNCHLTGTLSRFNSAIVLKPLKEKEAEVIKKYDVAVILSGPQPQKSIFKAAIKKIFKKSDYKVLMVTGEPHSKTSKLCNNIYEIPHLSDALFKLLLQNNIVIISRSGYTTIMDLWYFNKSAILVPTPGQTEQEYLAELHKKRHTIITQKKLQNIDDQTLISYHHNKRAENNAQNRSQNYNNTFIIN